MAWDPVTYGRFKAERDRPFFDLLAQIPGTPRTIADLGCGDGHLTQVLAARWPEADVVGVDRSAEMLAAAPRDLSRLRFEQGDLATWRPSKPLDLIVSNAALHWVPDHERLLARLVSSLSPDGILAVQVPCNHEAPSHRAVSTVAARSQWSGRFAGLGQVQVLSPASYLRALMAHDMAVDLWTTTYHQVLQGDDAVLRWLEGTTLRPYLERLRPEEVTAFRAALRVALDAAYPPTDGTVVFPFDRLFFVARREAASASTPSKPAAP